MMFCDAEMVTIISALPQQNMVEIRWSHREKLRVAVLCRAGVIDGLMKFEASVAIASK